MNKGAKPKKGVKEEGSKRRGRPPHPQLLEQRGVSLPDDLWQFALSQPEGGSALVRLLLERERARRASPFFQPSEDGRPPEDGRLPLAEVATPFGNLTVIELRGRGVLLLRDDERRHSLGYVGWADGWQVTFGEDDVRDLVRYREKPPGTEEGG